jgi:uncharacterized membrane protein YkgB
MTPLTQDPYVKVLTDKDGMVVGVATNICPLQELHVLVTHSQTFFNKEAQGAPFVSGADKVS